MYTVVLDARNAGLSGWWFIPVCIVIIALAYHYRESGAAKPRAPMLSAFLRNLLLILACLATAAALAGMFVGTASVRYRLNHRDYVLVEGVVSDFVPGDPACHGDELWRVRSGGQDHWYHYSASVHTQGYTKTYWDGGVIHNGVRVRIADIDGMIARLEVATSDLPAPP